MRYLSSISLALIVHVLLSIVGLMILACASALAATPTPLILFAIEPAIWVTVFIAFGAVCVLSVGWPVFQTFATDVSGPSQATAVGMMSGSSRLDGVLGSSLGGAFLAIGGFDAVGIFCLVTVVISALIMQLFIRDPRGVNGG